MSPTGKQHSNKGALANDDVHERMGDRRGARPLSRSPWGVSASIDEVNPQYRAEVAGEDLGTFATLEEARAALDERMQSRFGIGA